MLAPLVNMCGHGQCGETARRMPARFAAARTILKTWIRSIAVPWTVWNTGESSVIAFVRSAISISICHVAGYTSYIRVFPPLPCTVTWPQRSACSSLDEGNRLNRLLQLFRSSPPKKRHFDLLKADIFILGRHRLLTVLSNRAFDEASSPVNESDSSA